MQGLKVHLRQKYFKLNEKIQAIGIVLTIDPHNHTYPHINNTLSVYLTNQMLEQSLKLYIFLSSSMDTTNCHNS